MATMATSRKTISVHDYPEHLNPFHEDDNHNKIRFWTLGRKLSRTNSINFSGIKDLKNSWAFRSFMKKGKKGQQTSSKDKSNNHVNGDSSPIMYRRAIQYSSMSAARNTVGSSDLYVYGGSVTPLPRSRFQERLRSPSQFEVSSISVTPRMARSEVSGSRLSMESTNPFDEEPVPPVRAARRKKKRAPLPPPSPADVNISSDTSELHINENYEKNQSNPNGDLDLDVNLNIELKIIEDEDIKHNVEVTSNPCTRDVNHIEPIDVSLGTEPEQISENNNEADVQNREKENSEEPNAVENTVTTARTDNAADSVSFPKIDIVKYRRNSSVNEDDIRLRRGNLEDFHSLTNKRSKSLNNSLDITYMTYDINLNERFNNTDTNGNEEPQKVVCKVYDENARKQSIDTVSSTEKEFLEIDRATRELEREISKLNSALNEEDIPSTGVRLSVSEIKRKFDQNDISSPNPIPKPRRSHYGGSNSP